MHFYKDGMLYIIFGLVLYILTPYLLNLVKDNGNLQTRIVKSISFFYIIIGGTLTVVKIDRMLITLTTLIVPWIIYWLNIEK